MRKQLQNEQSCCVEAEVSVIKQEPDTPISCKPSATTETLQLKVMLTM